MAAIVFDEGLTGNLKLKWGSSGAIAIANVRLYTAISPAISKNTVKANFTEVGAVMGYAAKTITSGDFAYSLDTTNHWVTATAVYTWTFSAGAGLTILGWYCTNTGNVNACIGEQFATSIVIPAAGGSLQLTINDKFQDCV